MGRTPCLALGLDHVRSVLKSHQFAAAIDIAVAKAEQFLGQARMGRPHRLVNDWYWLVQCQTLRVREGYQVSDPIASQ
jgi:hypothetical protein